MKMQDFENIIDGCAFLERNGSLYELVGKENGKFLFMNIRDDEDWFLMCHEDILTNRDVRVAY